MSVEQIRQFIRPLGLESRIIITQAASDTVEHAAQAVGCSPAQIAKTLAVISGASAALIVMSGDRKISGAAFRATFGARLSMILRSEVAHLVGYESGGVCPFGNPAGVNVFLDESLRRFDTMYVAAGASNATIRLTVPELEKASRFRGWVNVGVEF